MNQSVLVLVPLHHDRYDMSGTKFPERGVVNCSTFAPDQRIETGLSGIKWAEENGVDSDIALSDLFAVVKVDDGLTVLDSWANVVKFKTGYVVFSGAKTDCVALIKDEFICAKK